MAQASPESFFRDMNRILDRVYRKDLDPKPARGDVLIGARLERAREGAQALEDALRGLRETRERSQGVTAARREIDDLREMILELRLMSAEITMLRLKLGEPLRSPRRWGQIPPTGPDSGSVPASPSDPSPDVATSMSEPAPSTAPVGEAPSVPVPVSAAG